MIMFAFAMQVLSVPTPPPPAGANYDISCRVFADDGKNAIVRGQVRQAASEADDWDTTLSLKSGVNWLPAAENRFFTKLRTLTATRDADGHHYVWWLHLPPESTPKNTYIALSDYVSGDATSIYIASGLCDLTKIEPAK